MVITAVKCHVLLDPQFELGMTSSAQDDLVVEVQTDDGIVGVGESDVNAWIGRACIEAPGTHTMDSGLGASLIGLSPLEPEAVWDRLYVQTAMAGRRGAVVHALGALDMALWDLCGKVAQVPTWQRLGARVENVARPYASLLPQARTFEALVEGFVAQALDAQKAGFCAAKLELLISGPYASMGVREPDSRMTDIIAAVRAAVGPEFVLMVDVGYAWDSVGHALRVIESWVAHDIYMVETPLWMDDLDGYSRLTRMSPIRIAAGEWLATRHEFRTLVERGCVSVLQPDVGRVGGLTEARRVCELAELYGLEVIPHSWKTGITVAATAHLSIVTPCISFMEVVPKQCAASALRRELLEVEPEVRDGALTLPDLPGLGVVVDRRALRRFEGAADGMMAKRRTRVGW